MSVDCAPRSRGSSPGRCTSPRSALRRITRVGSRVRRTGERALTDCSRPPRRGSSNTLARAKGETVVIADGGGGGGVTDVVVRSKLVERARAPRILCFPITLGRRPWLSGRGTATERAQVIQRVHAIQAGIGTNLTTRIDLSQPAPESQPWVCLPSGRGNGAATAVSGRVRTNSMVRS